MERDLKKTQKEMLNLEFFFPHHLRQHAERFLFAMSVFLLSFSVFFSLTIGTRFEVLWPVFQGLFLVSFSLLLLTILIEIYFNSLRLRLLTNFGVSFATFLIITVHHLKHGDLAKAFLHSHLGKELTLRLGIARESVLHFLKNKKNLNLTLPNGEGLFEDIAQYLHDQDPQFREFFDKVYVSKDLLMNASKIIEEKHHAHLSARPFLSTLFHNVKPDYSIDKVIRNEIDELEHKYHIIITEQAIQYIVNFLSNEKVLYASYTERKMLITELIEWCLSAHKKRFHGASIILPSDIRNFFIHKKSQ